MGGVQADSLKMDKFTLERLQQIHTQQRSLVAGKSTLSAKTVGLILADIPPLQP